MQECGLYTHNLKGINMLVLTRNQGQSIVIQTSNGEIEITIANVAKNGQVRVAIAAPDNVDIWRSELLEDVA